MYAIRSYYGFRERTFPGERGRLRSDLWVDTDRPLFESAAGTDHIERKLDSQSTAYPPILGEVHIPNVNDNLLIKKSREYRS